MSAQSWLNSIWYGGVAPPWWLTPLSAAYAAVSKIRRFAYARRWVRSTRLPCAVIVVGNLTVGGTGKTPLVSWLAGQLAERGFRPGVVSRGYGGSSRTARLVQASDAAEIVGDEAILLARRSRAPIATGRNRPAAAQLLVNAGCDVILSDDGLQHYALQRDCEIIVVDGDRRFGNGRMLPAGPLRETAARLESADAIVLNGGDAPCEDAMRMQLLATNAIALKYGTAKPLQEFSGRRVHALAAIGNPQRFFALLRSLGIDVVEHPLPDHKQLKIDDISFPDDLPVLMTEKDAVKCEGIAGPHHWFVPVNVVFAAGDSEKLRDIVAECVATRAART